MTTAARCRCYHQQTNDAPAERPRYIVEYLSKRGWVRVLTENVGARACAQLGVQTDIRSTVNDRYARPRSVPHYVSDGGRDDPARPDATADRACDAAWATAARSGGTADAVGPFARYRDQLCVDPVQLCIGANSPSTPTAPARCAAAPAIHVARTQVQLRVQLHCTALRRAPRACALALLSSSKSITFRRPLARSTARALVHRVRRVARVRQAHQHLRGVVAPLRGRRG